MSGHFLRPRSNRIIIITFGVLCLIIALSSRLPVNHPARARLREAFSYDLNAAWGKSDAAEEAADYDYTYNKKKPVGHDHLVEHHHVIGTDTKTAHHFKEDGLVDVNPLGPHPIYELIQKAEKDWKVKNAMASKDLKQAVAEYKRRYGRNPPRGFDKWWQYVLDHRVLLPDEYDRIYSDLEPFWAVHPSVLQSTQASRESQTNTFTISNVKGKLSLTNHTTDGASSLAESQLEMLEGVSPLIPDFRATFGPGETPTELVNYELRRSAREAAREGKLVDTGKPLKSKSKSWAAVCPADSPLSKRKSQSLFHQPSLPSAKKAFIHDHKTAVSQCLHPSLLPLNGFTQSLDPPNAVGSMVPMFSGTTTALHADILTVPSKDWVEVVLDDPLWPQKTHKKVYWRGNATGLTNEHWQLTQRVRLVGRTMDRIDEVYVLPATENKYQAVGEGDRTELSLLNEEWFDVRFTGCPEGGQVCAELDKGKFPFVPAEPKEYEMQWRYLIDVDGNGASSRFKRLMTTRGVVLKATIFPEWYFDRIQPWVHYVPIQYDLSDLYDIMAFFKGDIDGHGAHGHDELAAIIGMAGRKWSMTYWRKEDMIAYVFRLFLEYARVMSLDRSNMDFQLP